ncbi:hypothetical protein VU10_05935 [Desulfobulbus sp. US1]|nr:hypothetical protein [Desulfobulbus sp. US4]MCW5207306.1 hypothetical protein [Desulfobulbus sp. US2]MCW5209704.1 hypothetical protein [Desulfobulbus sp. US1]WLE96464.1 MAG: hypothetical protein QTN59_17490 [Candidatus Electrothrix communis]
MKKIVLLTLLISMLGVFSVQANQAQVQFRPAHGFMPKTGDAGFDQFLVRVNTTAEVRIETYITDLSTAFHVPAQRINRLIHKQRMAPADVLLVLQVANMSGAPLKRILQQYRQFRPKGWQAVFTSFHIYPGSRFFLILRQEMPTVIVRYVERWEKGSKKKRGSKRKGSKKKRGSKGKGSKRR